MEKKYDLMKHTRIKMIPQGGGEPYVMPEDYMGQAVTITHELLDQLTQPEIPDEVYEEIHLIESRYPRKGVSCEEAK